MKFTYEDKPAQAEPVAYIDNEGDLRIRLVGRGDVMVLCTDLSGDVMGLSLWAPDDPANHRVFYPGDSITITF